MDKHALGYRVERSDSPWANTLVGRMDKHGRIDTWSARQAEVARRIDANPVLRRFWGLLGLAVVLIPLWLILACAGLLVALERFQP